MGFDSVPAGAYFNISNRLTIKVIMKYKTVNLKCNAIIIGKNVITVVMIKQVMKFSR
jgi:uncharacterized protein YqkB